MLDLFTGHSGVMGQNFTIMVLGFTVAYYYGRLTLRSAGDPARLLMAGIAVGGAAWAFHRGYWWLWRFDLAVGNDTGAATLQDNADWLILVVCLSALSYLTHLNRWARAVFGPWAWPASVGLAFAVYIIGALPGVV